MALAATALQPAVPIKKSIFPAYIVCLEDGKKLKMLQRHLQSSYGMTPDQYRAKWGLLDSYPMTAPDYAARRSILAKKAGLGRMAASSASIESSAASPEIAMPEVSIRKFPAKTRGRKPGSKNIKRVEAELTAE